MAVGGEVEERHTLTVTMKLKNVKDRLKDETLDLSLCDLEDVPVREIATVRKATHLDLSNNLLVSLPSTFINLKQIVKLDLSKNMLTEIPENFGEMKQLKHLDLYANQISRLPLSLSELKNLRWLDLKENPLTPAVASVAGPCSNLSECQACARNIVAYLSRVKLAIEEEKTRRQNIAAETNADIASSKKENKKKKKKSGEKEGKKSLEKNGSKPSDKLSQANGSEATESKSTSNHKDTNKSRASKGKSGRSLRRTFASIVARCLLFCLIFVLTLAILPLYSKQQSEILTNYLEARTGMPVKAFQKNSTDALYLVMEVASAWSTNIYAVLNATYEKHIKGSVNVS